MGQQISNPLLAGIGVSQGRSGVTCQVDSILSIVSKQRFTIEPIKAVNPVTYTGRYIYINEAEKLKKIK